MDINIVKDCHSYRFVYRTKDLTFEHTLIPPNYVEPSDDALFIIAMTARPNNQDEYRVYGPSPSKEIRDFFKASLSAKIVVSVSKNERAPEVINQFPTNSYLCFSGGFDSVASKYLLDDKVNLCSFDFGGAFSREAIFFTDFDTNIIKWELRGKREGQSVIFNESIDWRFMLAPSLLFKTDGAEPFGVATGTIMEASPFWFSGKKRQEFAGYSQYQFGNSVGLINPVASVSEYVTALIAKTSLTPAQLTASLDSLASKKSFKRFRKEVLMALTQAEGRDLVPDNHGKKYVFGSSFTDDIVALYIKWKCGDEWCRGNYCEDIPDVKFNMSFFEKYNIENMKTIDPTNRSLIIDKLESLGVHSITTENLQVVEEVASFLHKR